MIRILAAIAALFLWSSAATAQTFPPLSGQVVDAAGLLNPAQKAALVAQADEIEKASTRQFVVATIPDLQGYPIEDYGYRLGREWKIGQKDANNGILLIVAPNERKVRIEVGYGLEPIMTDALSSQIIRNTILPKFKAGDLPGGIMAGAAEIAEQMKLPLEAGEARAAALVKKKPKSKNSAGDWVIAIIIMTVIFFVVLLPLLFGRSRGRRYRSDNVAGAVGEVLLWTALNSLSNSGGRSSGWGGGGGSDWGGGGGSDWGGGGGGSFGGGGSSGSW
ncbi:YgcG family protein [Sphingomonas sp. 28-62-11]|uniref:TPM domain-containing protein n=1 Tax=Sphingomonas sp. 28-62-11 TaxID=1970432 RepID=UPI000BD4F32F|nr:MAG: hypothetical protein B7Y49_11385 [Sphingomonas sp. 28-62-11]